jgi:phosphatidylserine/phosphatidylglycerophosphate/cardiolipin synthase-like enzyme
MTIIISSDYAKIVVPLIEQAKTNLDILMYQWGFYPYLSETPIQKLNHALKSAITRGVSCRVLLHPGNPADHLSSKNAATASSLRVWGAEVKFGSKGGCMHAKTLIIDKRLAIVGSHNFSQKSMTTNVELGVVVDDAASVRTLYDYFEILWRQS